MAFIEGISRLQRIIDFISIDFRSKKEIMSYLREYNTIISYKTLERDLKQIKEELGFDLEYKRSLGYRCENKNIVSSNSTYFFSSESYEGFENELYTIINIFSHNGITYCNCEDKRSKKIFVILKYPL